MFRNVWFLILLKLVAAVDYEKGPECQAVPPCDPTNENCDQCDIPDAVISINETDFPGRFKTHVMGNGSCRVKILNIWLYRYEYNATMCNKSIIARTNNVLHSQNIVVCEPPKILSNENGGNGFYPKINLIHYMDMVYDGCYELVYSVTYNSTNTAILTKFVYFNNNYTKEMFDNQIKDVNYITNIVGPSGPVTMMLPYRVADDEFSAKLFKEDYLEGVTKLCMVQYIPNGSKVVCDIPTDLAPGNYRFWLHLQTDWCQGFIFNRTLCHLSVDLTIVDQAKNIDQMPMSDSSRLFTICLVCLGIVAMATLLLLAHYRFGKRSLLCEKKRALQVLGELGAVGREGRDEGLKGIVLVYARDCEPFMRMVAQLRALLEERCGVKVYDIFDVEVFNAEIANAPTEWAGCMLSCPGIKFVLVKTRCGELLYESIINDQDRLQLEEPLLPSRTRYRKPLFADTYVHTLFRLVKEDAMLAGSYRKYFVVEIANFSGDRQFVCVNPYRRYELPGAVSMLVTDLRDSLYRCPPGEPEARLEEAARTLADYIERNPDYMMELLYKE